MSDRLFSLEQQVQQSKAQGQGLSETQACEDIPQANRLMLLEQSLDLSKQLDYSLSESDVTAFSTDHPWQVAVQFQLTEDDINALIDNNPPNNNELKSQYFKRLKEIAKKSFRKYRPRMDDEKISDAISRATEEGQFKALRS